MNATPTALEVGQAMMVALLEVRGDMRFKSYGEALDAMHAGLVALADNHGWLSRLAFDCQSTTQDMGWSMHDDADMFDAWQEARGDLPTSSIDGNEAIR